MPKAGLLPSLHSLHRLLVTGRGERPVATYTAFSNEVKIFLRESGPSTGIPHPSGYLRIGRGSITRPAHLQEISMIKVAMIGAGSVVFSKNLTGDILSFPEFKNATIAYMDIDQER